MKTWLILAFSILSFSTIAQTRWGLTAGPNYSSLHHKNYVPFNTGDPRIGFSVGGVLDVPMGTHIGLQAELAYTLAGAKGPHESTDLHYLMLPVSFTYAPLKWLKMGAGPQGGVFLGSNSKFDFRTFDYGVQAGIELMLKESLSIRVRNYYGLVYNKIDIRNVGYRYIDSADPLIISDPIRDVNRNNILQLTVQYYFSGK